RADFGTDRTADGRSLGPTDDFANATTDVGAGTRAAVGIWLIVPAVAIPDARVSVVAVVVVIARLVVTIQGTTVVDRAAVVRVAPVVAGRIEVGWIAVARTHAIAQPRLGSVVAVGRVVVVPPRAVVVVTIAVVWPPARG